MLNFFDETWAKVKRYVFLSLHTGLCARNFCFFSNNFDSFMEKENSNYLKKFWGHFCPLFGPPQRGWDLWFSFRSCMRLFVRSAEISKSVHRNFLFFFGTKLGLPNATEVTFSDFARKILLGRFWPILVKKGQFLKIYS